MLLTHAYIRYAKATKPLAEHTNVPIEGTHREDQFSTVLMPKQEGMFGFTKTDTFTPDRWLEQGDKVTFGDIELAVHFCPELTSGHVVFFIEVLNLLNWGMKCLKEQ